MTNFFYISGVIFWAVLAVIALAAAMYYGVQAVVKLYRKYIKSTLSNIWVYFFGSEWFRENNCAEIYFTRYHSHPGTIAHWHKPGCGRRHGYYRFLKEARKDMPEYLEKLRNNK